MSDAAVLEHHGVKGMKWGVHKKSSASSGSSGKPPAHPDAIAAKLAKTKVKSGSTDALSTKELQDLVQRLSLEKQFNQLREATPTEKGQKAVSNILLSIGKQQANRVVTQVATDAATKLVKKAAGK